MSFSLFRFISFRFHFDSSFYTFPHLWVPQEDMPAQYPSAQASLSACWLGNISSIFRVCVRVRACVRVCLFTSCPRLVSSFTQLSSCVWKKASMPSSRGLISFTCSHKYTLQLIHYTQAHNLSCFKAGLVMLNIRSNTSQ